MGSAHNDCHYHELTSIFSHLDFDGKMKILNSLKEQERVEFLKAVPAEEIASLFPYFSLKLKLTFIDMFDTSKQADLLNALPATELAEMFEKINYQSKVLMVSHLNETARNNLFGVVPSEETYFFLAELSETDPNISDKIRSLLPRSVAWNLAKIDLIIGFGMLSKPPKDAGKLQKTLGFLVRRAFDFGSGLSGSVHYEWNEFLKKCEEQKKRGCLSQGAQQTLLPGKILVNGIHFGGISAVMGGLHEAAEPLISQSPETVQLFANGFLQGIGQSVYMRLLSLQRPDFSGLSFRAKDGSYQRPPLATIIKALLPNIEYQSGFDKGTNMVAQRKLAELKKKIKKGKKLTMLEHALYQYASQRLEFSIEKSVDALMNKDTYDYDVAIAEKKHDKENFIAEYLQAQNELSDLMKNDSNFRTDAWFRTESITKHPDIHPEKEEEFKALSRKRDLFKMSQDEYRQELVKEYDAQIAFFEHRKLLQNRTIKQVWWTDPNKQLKEGLIDPFVDFVPDYSDINGWDSIGDCLPYYESAFSSGDQRPASVPRSSTQSSQFNLNDMPPRLRTRLVDPDSTGVFRLEDECDIDLRENNSIADID